MALRLPRPAPHPLPSPATNPRPLVEPTKERMEWAEHFGRIVQVSIASGAYLQALAAVERARREDPSIQPDFRSLSIGERYQLPLAELLKIRTVNGLEKEGYRTVGDIVNVAAHAITAINGVKFATVNELDAMFHRLGLVWTKRNELLGQGRLGR